MRPPSILQSLFALSFVAICATACSGHAGVPIVLQASAQAAAPAQAQPDSLSPCRVRATWYFAGPCDFAVLQRAGTNLTLASDRGITIAVDIGASSSLGGSHFVLAEATGNGDISGLVNGRTFPYYASTTCAVAGTCVGTVFMYMEWVNRTSKTITLSGSSQLTANDSYGFPGTTCFPAVKTPAGWLALSSLSTTPSGSTLSATLPGGNVIALPPGPTIVALSCF